MDLTTCDEEIPCLLHEWRTSGILPPHFAVVAQGGVPGEQSINRAETCAILAAAQFVQACPQASAELWTDSTFAMTEHQRVLHPGRGLPLP